MGHGWFEMRGRMGSVAVLGLLAAVAALLGGCGGGGAETGAEELARQHEIAAARHAAARSARQAEHLRQLEREVAALKRGAARDRTAVAESSPPEPAEPTTEPSDTPAAGGDWPGGSGYTAILASLGSEAEARATQRQASAAGLDAGVLLSSDYSSLRPGYWVVFSGNFGSVSEAAERASRAQSLGYADAYPRFVAP